MKLIILFSIIFLFTNCSKPKTVLICGDHICVNKAEANQYFEENLSIEVKILDRKKEESVNLVELNLINNQKGERKISVYKKSKTNKSLKDLSSNEILEIKKNIKNKKTQKKLAKKVDKKNKIKQQMQIINNDKKSKINKQNTNKNFKDPIDVCTILDKCSIDEISKYLLKQGKKKKFPDITNRQ